MDIDLATLIAAARDLGDAPRSPFTTPLVVLAAYVIGGLCLVPVTLLIAATGVVFGPLAGSLYALTGAVASAAASYYLGHRLGRTPLRRFAGPRMARLSRSIARRGLAAMIVIRLLPLAPFTFVNLAAGASHIRVRDFLLGTLIGMAPGILVTTSFFHFLGRALEEPRPASFLLLGAAALALAGVVALIRRRLKSFNAA